MPTNRARQGEQRLNKQYSYINRTDVSSAVLTDVFRPHFYLKLHNLL